MKIVGVVNKARTYQLREGAHIPDVLDSKIPGNLRDFFAAFA